MPSPEIVNTSVNSFAEIPKRAIQQPHPKKNYFENYLKSCLLLVAIYALIINRAMDAKKVSSQLESPAVEVKPDYTKAYADALKTKPHNSQLFNSGMPIIFYSNYITWK
jgi:hypothetical protein